MNTYSFNQYTVDTMVFALSSATVNRDQLVLSYGHETALDGNADRAPTNESFTVLVDGTRIDVSRVTVDAAARTVTLTLARAVAAGQTVTVAYQDTDTSDNKALQEAGTAANGGDDAASFAARAVTNLTRSPVAPATPEAPGASGGSGGPEGPGRLGRRTPTTTVCPTPRKTRPPACCAPMARPAWMATATATVSGTASRSPSARPAT
ncbi:SwmB domain-containing protein [Verminephrobacter eiseniae]|uniref:SwmB domain-containing protein n=1 Tax=Verminephrobacter eiseniae TaxID=364317 RepID=UPI0022383AF0|nr:SwmB domain-containing protein [Verminephrobacter eiseniae]